ncbi:(2Fe-2S) ferredoxin domain-containing protein [Bdellovibrio sp. HCB290]|uniref:(2Fe-2S) ferredoxin domain-containing protein n=1 Tax=Bdellovibrio sp. HCB290 TaxID=3394356 RepID=UPI0039B61FA5
MIRKEDNPWSDAIVMICTKCGKSISGMKEANVAENLKMFYKKSLKESGDGKKIRVVTSSCLDICEDEFQAITVASNDKTESFIMHPEKDRDAFLEMLKKKI